MDLFNIGITIIIIVKVIFIGLSIAKVYFKHKEPHNTKRLNNLEFWKKRLEFIFIALMSILLIYLFNPRINRINMIDTETRLLLYLFGFILILTADWSQFLSDSKSRVLVDIGNILGNEGSK